MGDPFTPPSVVVGIDGSADAVRAARWAVPEALSRDMALRLIAVADAKSAARQALAVAVDAVSDAGGDLRVETETVTGDPTPVLLAASREAAMICVGAVGLRHADRTRLGSTAGALTASASCPVAVVRGSDAHGWVAVELDLTQDSAAVLQCGVEEARLRRAPLRVLGAWQSRKTGICDSGEVAERNNMVRAQLDRRVAEWQRRYPDLDVRPVAVHGSMITYIGRNAARFQLIVVGAGDSPGVDELLGPPGLAALHDTDCSVLVVDRQRLL